MSFNIRCSDVNGVTWQERRELVAKQILRIHPDSVGLQEAHTGWMDYLGDALKDDYDYVGVGREDGKRDGEFSSVFYLKDKYAVAESGNFWLSQTPDVPSKGWDAVCTRICTFVRLRERKTGAEYLHINTHFDHIGEEAQAGSVDMIHDFAVKYQDMPVVFTADMNILEGSDLYKKMVSSVFTDTKHTAPDTMSCLTFHNGIPEKFRDHVIDFILVNDKISPLTYKVITDGIDGQFVSDHYPIYSDLIIKI